LQSTVLLAPLPIEAHPKRRQVKVRGMLRHAQALRLDWQVEITEKKKEKVR
jgi:hypothetical protein